MNELRTKSGDGTTLSLESAVKLFSTFTLVMICVFKNFVLNNDITSHGENGSRPLRPLYPRNND